MTEILAATSLAKGGLYNHFASKEELSIAAFDYAWERVTAHFATALAERGRGLDYLTAFADAFVHYAEHPVVDGGCPLANAAVDSDDAFPFLHSRVREALRGLRSLLMKHAQFAVDTGEFGPGTDPRVVADFMIAAFEGTAVVSRASGSAGMARRAMAALRGWLEALGAPS